MNRKRLPRLLIALAGIAALSYIGFAAVYYPFMEWTARNSYDVPFRWRGHIATPEVCLIYMDEQSAANLQQGDVWDRGLHARLLDRLREDGAKAVFFDVVFGGASENPAVDEVLAAAIKAHGNVFLGGAMDISGERGQYVEKLIPPLPAFRRAAAGWGLVVFRPIDADYAVRQLYTGSEQKESAAWAAARKLGAPFPDTPEERARQRWLNFYGPSGWFQNVSYVSALSTIDTPPGYFRDKIVFIGGRSVMGPLRLGKDEFANPYAHWRGGPGNESRFSPGVDIHATAVLNLLRGDWLTRLPERQEFALVVLLGLAFGTLFSFLRPIAAAVTATVSAVAITTAAFWLMWTQHLWFAWLVPVGLQIPIGFTWSVGANYWLESRRRSALRRAFSLYLSPQMADRISNSEFDLRPGGKVVEATVVFTDLEGFTTLSESLDDPEKVSEILTDYFTRTTRHVLENDGTISKYIGDAVLALWGAPVADPKHASKAALAAQRLHAASSTEVDGKQMRTRVGIHTGRVLAGNLGSAQRFDYTVIGDAVNFASRLEGLNKYLGTDILISEATRQQLDSRFVTRRLGAFKVVGKTTSVVIHELLTEQHQTAPAWVREFEEGVTAYAAGRLEPAQAIFEAVLATRGDDGPSAFYLRKISECDGELPANWSGVVEFSSK